MPLTDAMNKALTDKSPVARQYEKWVYPFPIRDLSTPDVRAMRDGADPDINSYTYWPDQAVRDDLDILIAGCGSNAAARYAFNHPQAKVTGIDFSTSSLAHEVYLKEKHGLDNLTLHHLRLEKVSSLGRSFDFIDVCGVLHHLPDPVIGLKALSRVLRPHGTIAVMVYGRYGRAGVYMLQEMFRLMGLGQGEADVATVKQTLAALPKRHAIHDYANRTRDMKYDAGLVDTFLHRQDRAYTVAECLDLVRQAGMSFMHWWDNILYYPEGQVPMSDGLYAKINALPEESIWQFMELYNGTLGQHSFCVCHPDRPQSTYKIDFSRDAFMDYIPVLRCREVATAPGAPKGCVTIQRNPLPAYTLNPVASALFKQIDGTRSVRDCFERAKLPAGTGQTPEAICKEAFQRLWRVGYIFLRLPSRD
jgi:SAM-dependent methyltransferase